LRKQEARTFIDPIKSSVKRIMATALYHIQNLQAVYSDKPVLEIESLDIRQGSAVGFAGPNGSGKTTLLRILALMSVPVCGSISFKGRPARFISPEEKRKVTLLLQEPYLLKRSVFENVAYGLKVRRDVTDLQKRVENALAWVGLAPDFSRRKWHALSGGEAQRVALAARLVLKPEVLILDEPTASVDAHSAHLIRRAVARARDRWGTSLLIASHNRQWLEQVTERTVFLFQGKVVDSGFTNMVFGPWHRKSSGHVEKVLPDGRKMVLRAPPGNQEVAMINPAAIRLVSQPPQDGGIWLSGVMLSVRHDDRRHALLITVNIGGHHFHVLMAPAGFRAMSLWPADRVFIGFNPQNVQWI